MEPFDEILGRMQVGSSHYARFKLRAPWSVGFSSGTQARLVVVTRGRCWLRWDGSKTPTELGADCVIVKPGVGFIMSDAPRRAPIACESLGAPHGEPVVEHGGRGEATELLIGRFSFDPVASEPLVAPLPPVVRVPLERAHAELLQSTLALIGKEAAQGGLGADFVVRRLTDALFVQAIRALFSQGCHFAPAWVTALHDGRVAKAIRAVHADLGRPWTVAEMAKVAGISRSSFAAAFTNAVGEPPLDYVTSWRIYRAKVLLASSDETLAAIAQRVGYDSDSALSRAFKREVGVPPGAFRRAASARTAIESRSPTTFDSRG